MCVCVCVPNAIGSSERVRVIEAASVALRQSRWQMRWQTIRQARIATTAGVVWRIACSLSASLAFAG